MTQASSRILKLVGALMVALLGALAFSLGVFALASVPDANLDGWQALAVAWGIIGVMGGCLMWVGAVFLVTWALVQ